MSLPFVVTDGELFAKSVGRLASHPAPALSDLRKSGGYSRPALPTVQRIGGRFAELGAVGGTEASMVPDAAIEAYIRHR